MAERAVPDGAPTTMQGGTDLEVAVTLARDAGLLLVRLLEESASLAPADLKTLGDAQSQEYLAAELTRLRPTDAVLSEEAKDSPGRLQADRVWIIDPVDGTREFSELGRQDWAVHVALWENGELAVGAVALPARGLVLSSDRPGTLPSRTTGPIRLVVSRTRPPALVTALAERLGAELVPMGSAGAKAMSILLGESDAYVHAGGQYEWDSAAPVAVARAAGLHCSRLDGSPLLYNRADVLLPDLVICRPELAESLLAAIKEVEQ